MATATANLHINIMGLLIEHRKERKAFGKLSRYAPSYPPTVYFVLLRRTRIQQATSLFPGRGGHVPEGLSFLSVSSCM